MIRLDGISKSYMKGKPNELNVLNQVSLQIEAGEMVAVMGKSGSGKSTLLHILGLLDGFDSGSYILDGVDISTLGDAKRARIRNEKIGYVVQDFALIEEDTVKNNIALPKLFQRGKRESKEISEILELVDLKGYERKRVKHLSGGEKQRVAIGRAIVNQPDIIMADEPTGNLDEQTGEKIMKLFRDLNETGTTVIVITHDRYIAEQCGRIIYIKDGKII